MSAPLQLFARFGLLGALAASARAQETAPLPPIPIAPSPSIALAPRAAFDAMLALQTPEALPPDNESGGYAWGESVVLSSLLRMFESTGDRAYLEAFIPRARHLLAIRDRARGTRDYRGLSLPGWSSGGPYTTGDLALRDNFGQRALRLQLLGASYFNLTRVTVATSPDGTFSLQLQNPRLGFDEKWTDLSLDRAAPNYFAARLQTVSLAKARLRVEDLAPPEAPKTRTLAPFEGAMPTPRVMWAVHQGLLAAPLAGFARLVHRSPPLRADARLRGLAEEFADAAEASLEILQPEWREAPGGEGFYVFAQGSPVNYDGSEAPLNQYLAPGRAMIELVAAGREKWRPQAEKMARRFKSNLDLDAQSGGYSWSYWPKGSAVYQGYSAREGVSKNTPDFAGRASAEDISHAGVDIAFVLVAEREGIVFTREDLSRFARTFLFQVVKTAPDGGLSLNRDVDGRAAIEGKPVPEWILLARVEPRLTPIFERLYVDIAPSRLTTSLAAAANFQVVRQPEKPQHDLKAVQKVRRILAPNFPGLFKPLS